MEHPLSKFKFCPICGSTRFEINNFKSKKCGKFRFTSTLPIQAAPPVAFIMNEKDELLVVRRQTNQPRALSTYLEDS